MKSTLNMRTFSLLLLFVFSSLLALSQQKKTEIHPVIPFSDTLYVITQPMGGFSAHERAIVEEERISETSREIPFYPDSFEVHYSDIINITYRSNVLVSITEEDTLLTGKTKAELAEERFPIIKNAITKQARIKGDKNLLLNIASIVIALVVVILLIRGIRWLFKKIILKIYGDRDRYFKGIKIKNLQIITKTQVETTVFTLIKGLRWLLYILVVYLALPVLFSVMPWAEGIADQVISWTLSPIKSVFSGIINYIPNLFFIAIILLTTRYILRFVKFLALQIESQSLSLPGFYPDWALPTFKIFKFIIYAFTLVVIFPYLPGSDSAVFKGVSVFLGILFSLGSSSAIGNMVAGLVITYMRPFKRGDRVKIGDVTGDVVEKTLLVTRVRTIKNEEITIPNLSILNGHTINFTTASEKNQGLILHTTITIGYDVSWRKVHELLIEAAKKTELIEVDPAPFVLQTSLDDFYVSYQINAYTAIPNKMAITYSNLYQNIQDAFAEAEIEIMSPNYNAIRDGNHKAYPDKKTPKESSETEEPKE